MAVLLPELTPIGVEALQTCMIVITSYSDVMKLCILFSVSFSFSYLPVTEFLKYIRPIYEDVGVGCLK